MILTNPGKKNYFKKKGLYEKLLCNECECLLNINEVYVKNVFFSKSDIIINRNGDTLVFENLEYSKFKLFQLSLLWRASVSKHEFFSNIDLKIHNEVLRNMVLTLNPGNPTEYGCLVIIPLFDKGQIIQDLILQPEPVWISSYECYRFIFGGAMWIFFITHDCSKFQHSDYFLNLNGKLTIRLVNARNTELFTKLSKNIFNKISRK